MFFFWYYSKTCVHVSVYGQSPTVKITESDPVNRLHIINVERDRDVTMNCFVENKQQGTQVYRSISNSIKL